LLFDAQDFDLKGTGSFWDHSQILFPAGYLQSGLLGLPGSHGVLSCSVVVGEGTTDLLGAAAIMVVPMWVLTVATYYAMLCAGDG
jgi:hypothetical protein